MTSYTAVMKTAISMPDGDFERFERVAARQGMSRSEFYRAAARRYADELEGTAELTRLADEALAQIDETEEDRNWSGLRARTVLENTEW
jgi:metal-responsive CopG/Arc/MetJ family transcriptional regulator